MSGETSPLVALCRNLNYADTAALHNDSIMSRHIADIVQLLPITDSISTRRALTIFFHGLNGDPVSLRFAAHFVDLYLNNPASPVRDEDLYILFLNSMLANPSLPEEIRMRGEEKLRIARLNRPGMVAADFRFVDREGRIATLHDAINRKTLLLFYDPECTHCSAILNLIAEDPHINQAVEEGSLDVLAIYAEGKRDVWEDSKWTMPASWRIGYDLTGILEANLYDLPAMPTIYILDSASRVLAKDPDVSTLLGS